ASGSGAAGASFLGGATQATAIADAAGVATSPLLIANGVAGRFTATASMSGVREPVTFTLDNLAARSPSIAVLGGARRTAPAGRPASRPASRPPRPHRRAPPSRCGWQ